MNAANAYQELEAIFTQLSHLQHLRAITSWDEAVIMPTGGGPARAKALATLSSIMHATLTQPKIKDLIATAKKQPLTAPWQQANLRLMEKAFLRATCLPSELVKKTTEAAVRCEQAWRIYRAENNWKDFSPLLAENIALAKEAAQIQAQVFDLSPLDVLIDAFSPDIKQALIDPIFTQLKNALPDLIKQAVEKQKNEAVIIPEGHFPWEKQRQLGLELMQAIGFDFNRGRLDSSHHPFCGGVPQDVRITTRYEKNEFIHSAMAICHETGHACYEQNLPKQWLYQPVGEALGMVVHESQSLLIEMQACRNKAFMHFLAPLIKNQFGDDPYSAPENLFKLYTRVKPGLIRVDADEMTYPLHVIIRYELEQQLLEGDLSVEDLPEVWDQLMTNYLGLSTKNNYRDGVMQDVHWPSAAFGYFPAYTFGNLFAAQLFHAVTNQHNEILTELSQGNFQTLLAWLNKQVHSRASSVPFARLVTESTGEALTPDYFFNHLKKRYLED